MNLNFNVQEGINRFTRLGTWYILALSVIASVAIAGQFLIQRHLRGQQDDSRVIEISTVSLQQKTDALAACTLLCLPSTQESFGGVYTEAWMFDKPVIGANIPAVGDVIDDGLNGYLVQPTAEAIAEKICYLLDHPAIAVQLGQAGRQKAHSQYSWAKLAQKTEDIYTQILRK